MRLLLMHRTISSRICHVARSLLMLANVQHNRKSAFGVGGTANQEPVRAPGGNLSGYSAPSLVAAPGSGPNCTRSAMTLKYLLALTWMRPSTSTILPLVTYFAATSPVLPKTAQIRNTAENVPDRVTNLATLAFCSNLIQ